MKVSLIVERGPAKGQEISLRKQKTVLGKSEQCDVRIVSNVTSRRHCEISMERDFVSLKDLGSRNGTVLNGKRITGDSFLADGDVIVAGDAVFKVKITQDERVSTHTAIVELAKGIEPSAPEQPAATKAREPEAQPQPEPAGVEIEEEQVPLRQTVKEERAKPAEPGIAKTPPKVEPRKARPVAAEAPKPVAVSAVPSEQPASPMTEEIITAESKPSGGRFETGFYERVIEGLIAAGESVSGHYERSSRKVSNIIDLLTRVLGIGEEERHNLKLAAMLYEVGKYYMATDILNKGAALTDAEKEHMKKHPQVAVRIFEKAPLPAGVREVIAHHHERYDGAGYPDGLKGEEIPAGARMLAIADALAAITSSRPYRPAMSTPQALDELEKNAGAQFDPAMVMKFVDYCRLHSGELRDAVNLG
jgi:HD-GYP domain-containing protein (c-di-GMP phosphodiesterase class II)